MESVQIKKDRDLKHINGKRSRRVGGQGSKNEHTEIRRKLRKRRKQLNQMLQ